MWRIWIFIRVLCDFSSNFWLWLICEGSEGYNVLLIIILGILYLVIGCWGVCKGCIFVVIIELFVSYVILNWVIWCIFCGVFWCVCWICCEGYVVGLWINEVLVDFGGGNWGLLWCVRFCGRVGSIGIVCVFGFFWIFLFKLFMFWIGWVIWSLILCVNDWLCCIVE